MGVTAIPNLANATGTPLMEKAKLFREHVQSIVTLATGALALSVTFLHDIATKRAEGWLIERAWYALVGTVMLGILYSYVLLIYVRAEGKDYGGLLGTISVLLHASFLGALVYLVRFAMANF